MKKIIFLLIFIAATCSCFSQNTGNTTPVTEKSYLQKSKNQKTAAFVLLGVGAALDIGGIIATASNADKEVGNIFTTSQNSVNHGAEYALYIAGTTALIGSLTLFIVSKSNKKKGMSVGLNTQQFYQLKKSNLYSLNYPSLTMKISLGK
jgi:hypothetical protein